MRSRRGVDDRCVCFVILTTQEFGRSRTLTSRCDLSQNLQKRGCEAQFIESPSSTVKVLKSEPLSSKGSGPTQYDVIQIMPQKISLSLRPGMSRNPHDGVAYLSDPQSSDPESPSPPQVTRPRLRFSCGRWRTILWICTT